MEYDKKMKLMREAMEERERLEKERRDREEEVTMKVHRKSLVRKVITPATPQEHLYTFCLPLEKGGRERERQREDIERESNVKLLHCALVSYMIRILQLYT